MTDHVSTPSPSVEEHPSERYRFLPGKAPFAYGTAASPGYDLVGVTYPRPVELRSGLAAAARWLADSGHPSDALTTVVLRSPRRMTFEQFGDYNADYRRHLAELGIVADVAALNPISRTHVVAEHGGVEAESMLGFVAALPQVGARRSPASFTVSAAAELRDGALSGDAIVRSGETSPDAMAEKAGYVLDVMTKRMTALGVGWKDVTAAGIYTLHPSNLWIEQVADRLGPAAIHGLRWYPSTPPVEGLEFEMDVRGMPVEQIVDT